MKVNTNTKTIYLLFLLTLIWSCQTPLEEPDIVDERSQMLEVMDFTAQVVSQVMISNDARQEILGYAFEENAGEVEASFTTLLSETPVQRSLTNNATTGNFAQSFRPKVESYQFQDNRFNKSTSANDIISDLEAYLKARNLGIYGPYLAEYHSNSTKPITVSFDPLDDSKTTNYGYIIRPKNSNIGQANHGRIGAPRVSLDDNYELELVPEIDDDYAIENPVLVIVPLDGDGKTPKNVSQNTGQTPRPQPNNGINCQDLQEGDILIPTIARFRLLGNLRPGFWNRNLMNMYAVTKDDISFDINNNAVVNPGVAQVWNEVRISRRDANKRKWKDVNTLLDSNWKLDEDNLFLAISYKVVDVAIDKINVEVSGKFSNKGLDLGTKVSANLKFEEKHTLLYSFPWDKCAMLALYKTPSVEGLERGLRIEKVSNKAQFTFDIEWYR